VTSAGKHSKIMSIIHSGFKQRRNLPEKSFRLRSVCLSQDIPIIIKATVPQDYFFFRRP
jgi:hypothetical protein